MTTAWALSVTTYHLLSDAASLRELKRELQHAVPDPSVPASPETLESLPFLTACIKEGLRLSYGVTARLSRVSPDQDLMLVGEDESWRVPAGTPVSMQSVLIHRNARLFPSPSEFVPKRWLDNKSLDRYLVSFSKGSRQCVGINIAYAELYTVLASVFRVYGSVDAKGDGDVGSLALYDTTKRDVEIVGDSNVPIIDRRSKGIRVRVGDA